MSKISSIYVTHNVKRVINNPLDKLKKIKHIKILHIVLNLINLKIQ